MSEPHGGSYRCVFASGNPGKLREAREILGECGITLLPQSDFAVEPVAEDGATFVDNALLKARHAAAVTGLPAIADDSGLAVTALDGRPGVHSARFAGAGASDAQNIERLLRELEQVAEPARTASFHCAAVLQPLDGDALIATGQWRGRVLTARRGSGGFGYDPVFLDTELNLTPAQMSPAQKNSRSHRGQALRRLAGMLRDRRPA